MTIVEFLNARYDEYEAALTDATSGPPYSPVATSGGTAVQAALTGDWESADREVLWLRRDLAAKRALVKFCDEDTLCLDGGWAYTDRVLEFLALPYADHSDYDHERWTP